MKKKLIRIFIILFTIGVVSGIGVYIYVFHKPHRNLKNEKAAYVMTAQQLYDEFSADEQVAYAKYGDQAIQISGSIQSITLNDYSASIVLNDELSGINCAFDSVYIVDVGHEEFESLKQLENITIKGKCDGYDMIMGVVLSRCVIVDE